MAAQHVLGWRARQRIRSCSKSKRQMTRVSGGTKNDGTQAGVVPDAHTTILRGPAEQLFRSAVSCSTFASRSITWVSHGHTGTHTDVTRGSPTQWTLRAASRTFFCNLTTAVHLRSSRPFLGPEARVSRKSAIYVLATACTCAVGRYTHPSQRSLRPQARSLFETPPPTSQTTRRHSQDTPQWTCACASKGHSQTARVVSRHQPRRVVHGPTAACACKAVSVTPRAQRPAAAALLLRRACV